jgi:addiction module RelB/DinJ family antitoxin
MVLVTKSATIQIRVMPFVKAASERILLRIGLNMSEAVELFLRRMIIDQRIPFDVVALPSLETEEFLQDQAGAAALSMEKRTNSTKSDDGRTNLEKKRHRQKKEFKKFSGAPQTPSQIRSKTTLKKGTT